MEYTLDNKVVSFKVMRGVFTSTSDKYIKEAAETACFYLLKDVHSISPEALACPRIEVENCDAFPILVRSRKILKAIKTLSKMKEESIWYAVKGDFVCAIEVLMESLPDIYTIHITRKNMEEYQRLAKQSLPSLYLPKPDNKTDFCAIVDTFEFARFLCEGSRSSLNLSIVKRDGEDKFFPVISLSRDRNGGKDVQILCYGSGIPDTLPLTIPKDVTGERTEAIVKLVLSSPSRLYYAGKIALESNIPFHDLLPISMQEEILD